MPHSLLASVRRSTAAYPWFLLAFALLLRSGGHAATYYVSSTSGNDGNPGSLAQPWATLGHATGQLQPGDTLLVRAGEYHETVTIPSGAAKAPITVASYPGEKPVLLGVARVTGGWTLVGSNIYRTHIALPLGDSNQLFFNRQMLTYARWPNLGSDISHPTKLFATAGRASDGTTATLTCPNVVGQKASVLAGTTLHIALGKVWVEETYRVTQADVINGVLTFNLRNKNSTYQPQAGNPFFLTGKLELLDAPGEWFYDSAAQYLYVRTPDDSDPNAASIEYKDTQWLVDLSGQHFVKLSGLSLFGGSILTDPASSDIELVGLDLKYLSHFGNDTEVRWVAGTYKADIPSGVVLDGTRNVIRASSLAYSAGYGVLLTGSQNAAIANSIQDVDYAAAACAGIGTGFNPTVGATICDNVIARSGLRLIELGSLSGGKVTYNVLSEGGLQLTDFGAIYAANTDGGGTEIAYNICHDLQQSISGGTVDNNSKAIYLDNGSDDYLVHHNVSYNVRTGLILNAPTGSDCHGVLAYHNTFDSTGNGLGWNYSAEPGCVFANNLFLQAAAYGPGATQSQNLTRASSTLFVNVAAHDYTLNGDAVGAIDAGIPITGIDDGFVGVAPDLGAFEFGKPAWNLPTISMPADITVEATSSNGAVVNFIATAVDKAGISIPVQTSSPSGAVFPLGTTTVTVSTTDLAGFKATSTFQIRVVDTTPPAFDQVAPTPNILWPVNHKLVPVTVTAVVHDAVTQNPSVWISSVSANQPTNGQGDGNTSTDWKITGPLSVELRAERSGTADQDRVYTLTLTARDQAGNESTHQTTVTVPHSQ